MSNNENLKNYDIIGDIHGYATELEHLLQSMGYNTNNTDYYKHSMRKVIFVGDFIDRGQQQKQVIQIVRAMVDNNAALAVMGNHEFNAISFHTLHPITRKPLRKNDLDKTRQHQAFLEEYTDKKEINAVLNWFKSLPLFLELDDIRIIHASWNVGAIACIQDQLDANNCLNEAFLIAANQKGTPQFKAIEILLKGIELQLPEGISFKDSYQKQRRNIRIKWWPCEGQTLRDLAIVPTKVLQNIPEIHVNRDHLGDFIYQPENKPVFFGHYWMTGQPKKQGNNVACLDYSVAKNGHLTAYRWNQGDSEVSNDQFHQANV